MPKQVGLSILAGFASVTLFALPVLGPGMTILLFAVPLPLLIAGLSMGVKAAVIASLSGVTIVGTVFHVKLGLGFALVVALPVVGLTYLGLLRRVLAPAAAEADHPGGSREDNQRARVEWYPLGRLLMWLTGYTAALFLVVYLASLGHDGGLRGLTEGLIRTALSQNPALKEAFVPWEQSGLSEDDLIQSMANAAPAMMAVLFLIGFVANFLLALTTVVHTGRSLRGRTPVLETKLPEGVGLAFLASLGATVLTRGEPGYVSGSLATILFAPYFLMGLIVVHSLTRKLSAQGIILLVFYVALAVVTPLGLFVGCLGLADQWMHLRKQPGMPAS